MHTYEFECGRCGARFEDLVGAARRQDARNAELRARTKQRFVNARQRARRRPGESP